MQERPKSSASYECIESQCKMGNKKMWDILALSINDSNGHHGSDLNRTYLPEDYILWIANERLCDINKPIIIILILLIIFGLFGNFLVIYIFGFRLQKSTAHLYITSISTFDSFTCLLLIFEVFDKRFPMYSGNYPEICKLVRCLEVFANGCASLIMCSISVDRYYIVYKPFKRLSIRTVRKSILGIVIGMIVLSWPMVLFHGPETVKTIYPSITGRDCADDEYFKGSVYPGIYFPIVFVIILSTIIVTVVMYCLIFIKIFKWKHNTIGESMPTVSGNLRKSSTINLRKSSKSSTDSASLRKSPNAFSHTNSFATGKLKDEQLNRENSYTDISSSQPEFTPETDTSKKSFNVNLQTDMMTGNDMLSNRAKSILFPTVLNKDNSNSPNPSVLNLREQHECTKGSTSTDSLKTRGNIANQTKIRTRHKGSFLKRSLRRRSSSRAGVRLSSTTIMFSLTALLYVLSYIPTIIVESINAISGINEEKLSISTRKVIAVCNAAYFVNIAFNPIIYGLFNKFFRDKVRDITLGNTRRSRV